MTTIAVFGLGEAGSLIAADLAQAGAHVHGFDPADVRTPDGVVRRANPVDAVHNADVVLGLTAAADAEEALRQALDAIPAHAVYADLSTSVPERERHLAAVAAGRSLPFVDAALMSTVVGKGLATPQLASGPGARSYVDVLRTLGASIEIVGDDAGDAATRKLLRSILMKGLAALGMEALRAGHAAEVGEWLWAHLAAELDATDGKLLARLIAGMPTHVARRRDEMAAAVSLLDDLEVEAHMTRATMASLDHAATHGVPPLPRRSDT